MPGSGHWTIQSYVGNLYATAAEIWGDVKRTGILTEQHRLAMRLAATWTIHQAASVVDTAYHMAGATAVFPLVLGPDGREPWFAGYQRAGLDLLASTVLDGRIVLVEYRRVPGR